MNSASEVVDRCAAEVLDHNLNLLYEAPPRHGGGRRHTVPGLAPHKVGLALKPVLFGAFGRISRVALAPVFSTPCVLLRARLPGRLGWATTIWYSDPHWQALGPERRAEVARLDRGAYSDVGLHTLRHSTGSALIERGVHMKVVQELLRHSSYAITADIYSHVAVEQRREAAERLGEAFPW